ncbi:MAG: amidohydrolase family protein [Chloroflexi bacterium]|nr:amidohydrolase family protein [Chloroflexota bacterium]
MIDLVVTGGTLATDEWVERAALGVHDGKIVSIGSDAHLPNATEVIDATGMVVVPGAIDTHSHIAQSALMRQFQGASEHTMAANYLSETRSAVAGGTTCALNYIFTQESLHDIFPLYRRGLEQYSLIDMLFHGALMNHTHLEEAVSYAEQLGIHSHKIFMPYRGEEARLLGGISSLNDAEIWQAFQILKTIPSGLPIVHAENPELCDLFTEQAMQTGGQDMLTWEASRPPEAEGEAIRRVTYFARKVGVPLAIAHVSSSEGVEVAEHDDRYPMLETCGSYLALDSSLPFGPLGKVTPPIRSARHRDQLWEGIRRGTVRFLGSDHNCWPARFKEELWSGMAGIPGNTMLWPVLLTDGYLKRDIPLQQLVGLACANAARTHRLYPRKGSLAIGADADLAIMDLRSTRRIRREDSPSITDYTPFEGYEARAWPYATVVRGRVVYREGQLFDVVGSAQCLNVPESG